MTPIRQKKPVGLFEARQVTWHLLLISLDAMHNACAS